MFTLLLVANFSSSSSSLPPPLSFGRGMKGPERGHVRHTTALPWGKTVTRFAIMTTQRKQWVVCCLSNKLHLCVHPSQLGTQTVFHVSALLCHHRSHRRHRSHPLGVNPCPSPPCHAKPAFLAISVSSFSINFLFCPHIADFWILLFLLTWQVREHPLF